MIWGVCLGAMKKSPAYAILLNRGHDLGRNTSFLAISIMWPTLTMKKLGKTHDKTTTAGLKI
jgi:hypothetical protein